MSKKHASKSHNHAESRQDLENIFRNNPFRDLNRANYPAAKTINVKGDDILEDEDSLIFLNAISKIPQTKTVKRPTGFFLAEQCAMPVLEKKDKKAAPMKTEAPVSDEKEEETNEFLLAMRSAAPLPAKGRQIAPTAKAKTEPAAPDPDFADLLGEKLEFALLYSDEYLEGRVADLDDLLMNRLREGQMSPEAHVDMHGLNALQAFEELKFFIRNSWYKGLRIVLAVTGRGKNSPAGQAVLRRKIQTWLTQEPFKRVVLAFCTALPQDGGPGSIYILLRRFRKKGRIVWDRLPPDADMY